MVVAATVSRPLSCSRCERTEIEYQLPSHTSSTRTSSSLAGVPPDEGVRIIMVRGLAEAVSGSSTTRQEPLASAAAVFFCPANSAVTVSPGRAVPQTGAGMSRGSTMPLPKIAAVRTVDAATICATGGFSWRSRQKIRLPVMRQSRAKEAWPSFCREVPHWKAHLVATAELRRRTTPDQGLKTRPRNELNLQTTRQDEGVARLQPVDPVLQILIGPHGDGGGRGVLDGGRQQADEQQVFHESIPGLPSAQQTAPGGDGQRVLPAGVARVSWIATDSVRNTSKVQVQ